MRDTIESIRALYERLAAQTHEQGRKEAPKSHQASQTSPLFRPVAEPRRKGTGPDPPNNKRSKRETSQAATRKREEARALGQTAESGTQASKDAQEWNVVGPKKKMPKKQRSTSAISKEKPRPDALVITVKGESSYADILRQVKQDKKLQGLGEAVSRIRRTQKGELLLQLKKSGEETAAFKALVSEAVGDQVEVRSLSHKIEIECRDLDEITTKEEVSEAIGKLVESPGVPVSDILLRKAFGQTQTAIIRLPAACARKATKIGWLKVGWVRCRLRERTRRWDSTTKGRWTHRLIPNIQEWIGRTNGQVSYQLTQFFTGHGGYRKYLHRFGHDESPVCPNCPGADEDPEHILYNCRRYRAVVGSLPDPEQLVEYMCSSQGQWDWVSQLIAYTQGDLRRLENERRLRENA
ncbi:hypothetical protein KR074_006557 [Drosophila pseudoananassae]|nr:hypothetical protein KR074_006557 [Drosophila pseudoananassae]